MLSYVLLATLFAVFTFASSVHSAQLYHRDGQLSAAAARPTTRNMWAVTAVAPTTAQHTVTIAMHFENIDYMRKLFHDIHDPLHPQWLNHLTREQVHDIIAPPKATTDRLLQWMQDEQGVPAEHVEYLIGANAIRVDSTIGHINRLFNTTMHEFTHADGYTAYRQLGGSYVLDEFLPLIHFVDGLVMMPYAMKKHIRIMELDANLDREKERSPSTASTASSSDEHRHSETQSSDSSSGSRSPVSPSQPVLGAGLPNYQTCGFYPIVPVNSMYGRYNIPDQSSASVGSAPNTSTQTVQFYTSNGRSLEANSFSPSDLSSYSQLWSQSSSSSALKVQTVTGANDASNPTDEPSLDVQSITPLSPTAANQFELVPSGRQQYWWAAGFVSRTNIAQVVSISYGIDESAFLLAYSPRDSQDNIALLNYLAATNNLYMLIGARGTTILVSSGDDGAQGVGNASPQTSATKCNYSINPFEASGPVGPSVEFPASSPYVTAVGGTEINAECSAFPAQLSGTTSPMCSSLSTNKLSQYGVQASGFFGSTSTSLNCLDPSKATSESAVSIGGSGYTSGGGFSRYYMRSIWALWQDRAVTSYLTGGVGRTPSAAFFNSSGRAIPDVAMYGGAYPVIIGGQFSVGAGTSLSAPLFAAVISLLNQQTLAAKGATIGFANPMLYAMAANSPSTFTDITTGDNICPQYDRTATSCPQSCQGYTAARGWDPVTGLGVPNVGAMQAALSQYLIYAQGKQTGSVTGITGASYSAAASTVSKSSLLPLLGVLASVMTLLVL